MASRLARLRRLQPGRQGDPPDSPGPLGSLGGVESAADGRMGGVAGVHGRALSTPGLSRGLVPLVAPFLPAVAITGIWLAWIPFDGGYFPGAWDPAAVFVVALACGPGGPGHRGRLGAPSGDGPLALFWAFAARDLPAIF